MMSSEEPSRAGRGRRLSHRQREIVEVIARHLQEHGCSPSNREIAEAAGLASVSTVSHHLRVLKAAGIVSYDPRCPRTVRVLPEPGGAPAQVDSSGQVALERVAWVPIVGRIAAGVPIRAEQVIESYLPLPKDVVGGEEGLFILEIVGDSMIGAGILPGDWVVVRQLFQPPRDGDIVAATIDGVEVEGTVKTYKKVGRQIWLMPHNSAYTPIPGDKAKFDGKVVAVLRRV